MEMFPNVTTKPHGLKTKTVAMFRFMKLTHAHSQNVTYFYPQPTSPSLMESAAAFLSSWMGWLLYRVLRPPTILPRNSTLYTFP